MSVYDKIAEESERPEAFDKIDEIWNDYVDNNSDDLSKIELLLDYMEQLYKDTEELVNDLGEE